MSNPWDRLPILDSGDDNPRSIYTAVGMALTTWERLEAAQSRLFSLVVRSPSDAAGKAFGMVLSQQTEAKMLIEAARVAFFDKRTSRHNASVKELVRRVGRFADRPPTSRTAWFTESASTASGLDTT